MLDLYLSILILLNLVNLISPLFLIYKLDVWLHTSYLLAKSLNFLFKMSLEPDYFTAPPLLPVSFKHHHHFPGLFQIVPKRVPLFPPLLHVTICTILTFLTSFSVNPHHSTPVTVAYLVFLKLANTTAVLVSFKLLFPLPGSFFPRKIS